jgi:hypothetical protein
VLDSHRFPYLDPLDHVPDCIIETLFALANPARTAGIGALDDLLHDIDPSRRMACAVSSIS